MYLRVPYRGSTKYTRYSLSLDTTEPRDVRISFHIALMET